MAVLDDRAADSPDDGPPTNGLTYVIGEPEARAYRGCIPGSGSIQVRKAEQVRKALIAVGAVAMLVFAGAAMAGQVGHAVPWKYDPGKTGTVVAHWTKDGLSLQKNTATATNAAAGADIKGVEGDMLKTLSFEMKDGTYCGAGAPRFNVHTQDGTWFLGCIYGDKKVLADGWTRVTFDGDEPFVGGFESTITGADVVMDEEGRTLLRNIFVNGEPITR